MKETVLVGSFQPILSKYARQIGSWNPNLFGVKIKNV